MSATGKWPLNVQIGNYSSGSLDQETLRKAKKFILTTLSQKVKRRLQLATYPVNFFKKCGTKVTDFDDFYSEEEGAGNVLYC